MELLRESRLTGPSSLLVGLAIGTSLMELRLCLYFFALDGLLAGPALGGLPTDGIVSLDEFRDLLPPRSSLAWRSPPPTPCGSVVVGKQVAYTSDAEHSAYDGLRTFDPKCRAIRDTKFGRADELSESR